MTPPTMLLATRSEGKLHELTALLAAVGIRAMSLADVGIEPSAAEAAIETFDSFDQNARAKARYFREHSRGLPVLAEDSGLEVSALQGAPGVRSKRWSAPSLSGLDRDEANIRALLEALAETTDRRARYVCVAVVAWDRGEVAERGECAGTMLESPRGSSGFGYDPLFLSDDLAKTFAEASGEEKARVSHRAKAVRAALAAFLARRP